MEANMTQQLFCGRVRTTVPPLGITQPYDLGSGSLVDGMEQRRTRILSRRLSLG